MALLDALQSLLVGVSILVLATVEETALAHLATLAVVAALLVLAGLHVLVAHQLGFGIWAIACIGDCISGS